MFLYIGECTCVYKFKLTVASPISILSSFGIADVKAIHWLKKEKKKKNNCDL